MSPFCSLCSVALELSWKDKREQRMCILTKGWLVRRRLHCLRASAGLPWVSHYLPRDDDFKLGQFSSSNQAAERKTRNHSARGDGGWNVIPSRMFLHFGIERTGLFDLRDRSFTILFPRVSSAVGIWCFVEMLFYRRVRQGIIWYPCSPYTGEEMSDLWLWKSSYTFTLARLI